VLVFPEALVFADFGPAVLPRSTSIQIAAAEEK
jgi:hypothetical protein